MKKLTYKAILILCLLISKISFAASWSLDIHDQQSKEVKNYKFKSVGKHKIQLPNFKFSGCMLEINEPKQIDRAFV